MASWKDLTGKKVVAFRGWKSKLTGRVDLSCVLFDRPLALGLEKQDSGDYHDCSPLAREIFVVDDPVHWDWVFGCNGGYAECADADLKTDAPF